MTLLLHASLCPGSVHWLLEFGYSVTEQWLLLVPFQQASERRSWFFNLDQICLFLGKKKPTVSMVQGTAKPILYKFSPHQGEESRAWQESGWMRSPTRSLTQRSKPFSPLYFAATEFSFHLDTANVSIEPQNHRKKSGWKRPLEIIQSIPLLKAGPTSTVAHIFTLLQPVLRNKVCDWVCSPSAGTV